MISRRSGLRIISLLLLLVLLGGYSYYSWLRLLERHAIRQLDWQGASLSLSGIGLARLDLRTPGAQTMTQGQPAALTTHGLGATGKEGFFTTRNARGAQTSDSMAHAQSAAR